MKIYLDINGTLIYRKRGKSPIFKMYPAKHLKNFLKNILEKHDVYWLSTMCRGSATIPIKYLSHYFDDELMEMIEKIKPTKWVYKKIEAINLDEEFLWFDDILHDSAKHDLEKAGKMDSFVLVDLDENEDFWLDWSNI